MNKYLTIAQMVLADSKSMLTARQIWSYALHEGYAAIDEFGTSPWIALGSALSREINSNTLSDFGCFRGRQVYYYLIRIDQSPIWGTFDFRDREQEGQDVLWQRIHSQPPHTQPKIVTATIYERDLDVIAYVRVRANHNCEMCGTPGFLKDNGEPYIEVHHLKRLADGGSDIPENAVALCADCHRKLHYMQGREILLAGLIAELAAKGIEVKPQ